MSGLITKCGKKVFSAVSHVSPSLSSRLLFLMRTHKWPNLKKPETFNEKTTWLKLRNYNHNELVSRCADKYAVREYVESKGCGEILNELFGVYDDFDEIDFAQLPDRFALKCVHGCAYNIIVDDKTELDINKARKTIKKWMKEKYGYATSELHYTRIKPRIIAEKYLCGKDGKMPLDYKFYCMNGEVKCVLVCSERDENLKLSYYDLDWNRLPYEKESWSSKKDIDKPKNLKKMIEYAEKLSDGFPFVRVDLYNDSGKIIFGELTFTPACSCAPYYSDEGDSLLGLKFIKKDECRKMQHIVAAVDKDGEKLYERMNIRCNAIVSNQNKKEECIKTNRTKFGELKVVNTLTMGVGKNRNIGLAFASSEVCILSDDDMRYDDDYVQIINNVFNRLNDADVLIFDIRKINSNSVSRPVKKIKRINLFNYMKYGGSRFVFKKQSIQKNNICFTELFGGGSMYSSGEDTVFLRDCLRHRMHIYVVPYVIATVDFKTSSWFHGADAKFFYDKGALLCSVAPMVCRLLAFYLAKRFDSEIGYRGRLKMLFAGIAGYRKMESYDDYCSVVRGKV